jgi:DNA-binding NtrC family response regulator
VEHAFGREAADTIRHDALPPVVRAGARSGLGAPADRLPTLAEAEAHLVGLVLEDSGGNKTEAARRLGIDRKRLYRKIRKYGLLGDAPIDDGDDD